MDSPYTYKILRYVHDIGTGEFLNVGVVVALCEAPCVMAKFTADYRRVQGAFPSLDTEVFLARMKRLQACFNAIDAARCSEVRACEGKSIAALIRSVLTLEDSALHWSPSESGAGGPPSATLQLLFERFVSSHGSRGRQ